MYENSGAALKTIAVVCAVIMIVCSVIGGIVIIGNVRNGGFAGVMTILIGSLVGWLSGLTIYTIGDTHENTEALLQRIQ